MNSCPSYEELVLHHDSELDSVADARVKSHTQNCGVCRAALEEMEYLDRLAHAVVKHKGTKGGLSRVPMTGPYRFN